MLIVRGSQWLRIVRFTTSESFKMLKFSNANAKIENLAKIDELQKYLDGYGVYSLDLLSGHSCPFATQCLSKAIVDGAKRHIHDGKYMLFRCFSASQEVQYPALYDRRKHNFDMLKACACTGDIVDLIESSMPEDLGICRLHVGGEFFSQRYFDAWEIVAENNPSKLFYAYTKSLPYVIKNFWHIDNFVLTASRGGRRDDLIQEYGLRESVVVYSEQEAELLGLEIDHDDSHAARPSLRDQSFALLIHGTQAKGSEANEALKLLRKNKIQHSYSRKQNSLVK